MAQVYIDSLTLENFGPFYGEHTLNFSNLDGRCGILIGGKNGAGKTHVLRALYLAVVGESGMGDLKRVETGADATRFLFDKSLNRHAQAEGKDTVRLKVTVSLRDDKNGGSRKVELAREIRHRANSSPVWKSYAKRSDTPGEIVEDEQVIQKLRDAFLPRHLARFFFFDAERSQSINLGQQDIVEGVSRILGLWTYGELETDLRQLMQNKIPRAFNSSGGADPATRLVDMSAEVQRVEGHLKTRRREQETLERDLNEVDADLLEVEDNLKALGAIDPEELQRSQERRNELTQTKAALETKLTGAWELAIPVSLLGKYRKEFHEYLLSEERRREWESARSSVQPKIPKVKEDVFAKAPLEFTLKPDVEAFYLKRLEDALLSLFHPPPEGMPDRIFVTDRDDTSAQIRARLGAGGSLHDLVEMCINIERMDAELRELDQKLKQMQQNATALKHGTELHQKRGELLTRRDQIEKRRADIAVEVPRLDAELGELKRQETNQREIVEKAEKGESLALLAARYREAAGEIRSQAAVRLRKRISEHVGELWVDITERKREFQGIDFDSHWQCLLIRRDNKRVTWEETNTSAGQRQVRMLAFYEALRRLAKLVPPLVVDTPLARLDKEVRTNVLDQLYLSCHQSIILMTNSEVDPDGPLYESIRDRLARVYTLHPHGKPESADYEVRVTNDYFGRDL